VIHPHIEVHRSRESRKTAVTQRTQRNTEEQRGTERNREEQRGTERNREEQSGTERKQRNHFLNGAPLGPSAFTAIWRAVKERGFHARTAPSHVR
jgi:hypothetical protein